MSWTVFITSGADRRLKRLSRKTYLRIRVVLGEMEHDPWTGDIVKMGGKINEWRRRIGAYRIKFKVFEKDRTIQVYEIERRTSTTY